MRAKKYLISTVVFFLLTVPAYFWVINNILAKSHQDDIQNYRNFIFKNTPGKRIIIDSGSNSYHAIMPKILERHFNMPVLNLADNAGFPLEHKFKYYDKHLRTGDVLILPLEWHHYITPVLNDIYVEEILAGTKSYFYHNLSLDDKLDFVFSHVPANKFLYASQNNMKRLWKPISERALIENIKKRLLPNNDTSFGYAIHWDNRIIPKDVKDRSCDEFLFKYQLEDGFKVNEHFSGYIEQLKLIRHKGVNIIFALPTVVDKDDSQCYSSKVVKDHLGNYVKEIRSFLAMHDFTLLGEPHDSAFPSKYFLDTPYHVTEEGSVLRTKKLISQLRDIGFKPSQGPYQVDDAYIHLKSRVESLLKKYKRD